MKKLLFLLLVVVAISSCSDDDDYVKPENIFMRVDFQYIHSSDQTYVTVLFQKGDYLGDAVKLTDDASVMLNGEIMEKAYTGSYYYASLMDDYQDTITIAYQDEDGIIYENELHLANVSYINIPGSFDELNINDSYTLEWNGEAIQSNSEYVSLEFGQTTYNTVSMVKTVVGSDSFDISSSILLEYGTGTMDMILARTYASTLENSPPAGGAVYYTYSSGTKEIELIYE